MLSLFYPFLKLIIWSAIFFMSYGFALAQNINEDYLNIYMNFNRINNKPIGEMIGIGDSLKLKARTPYEIIYSNLFLSAAHISNNEEERAIVLIHESLNLAQTHQLQGEKFKALFHLKDIYKKMNLEKKREEVIHRISKDLEKMEKQGDYFSIKADNLLDLGSLNANNPKIAEKYFLEALYLLKNNNNIFIYLRVLNALGGLYDQQKNYKEAEKYYNEILVYNQLHYNNSVIYQVIGHLNLASVSIKLRSLDKAEKHLDVASNVIEKNNLKADKEALLKIKSNFYKAKGDKEKEAEINREIIQLAEESKLTTNQAISEVLKHDQLKSEQEKVEIHNSKNRYLHYLLIVSVLSITGAMVSYMKNKKHKAQLTQYYDTLIETIKKDVVVPSSAKLSTEIKKEESIASEYSVIGITPEKEQEILLSLQEFESGDQYTDQNFSLPNLAAFLNTNTKYLTYILKKYRQDGYSEYINKLRVNYISQRLCKEPELLKYKINHLAELAGFSSHSRFTQIFKKEKNISPSAFIVQQKNNNNQKLTGNQSV